MTLPVTRGDFGRDNFKKGGTQGAEALKPLTLENPWKRGFYTKAFPVYTLPGVVRRQPDRDSVLPRVFGSDRRPK